MLLLHDFENEPQKIIGDEGVLQRTQLVEDDAERPHIALGRVRLTLAGLRTHIIRRADNSHCRRI